MDTETRPLDPTRAVPMHRLTYLEDGEDVTVGRQDIDSYCVLPADGAALLRRLEDGATPDQAAAWFTETYGQPVDVAEFLEAMAELGFLLAPGERRSDDKPVRWQRLGRAVFSPPAWVAYAALIATAAVFMIRDHRLIPQYGNIFFAPYIMVLALTVLVLDFPLVLLHEGFHALAGRRLGLNSKLGFGRRLYFLVVVTSLDGLVSVPRGKRYLPILAGVVADLLAISALTLVGGALRRPDGTEPVVGGVCLALAFATTVRFLWQLYFYLQTDCYYLIVTVLGCVDLQKAARRILADRVFRVLRMPGKDTHGRDLHPTDAKVGRWYSWLLLAGWTLSLSIVAFQAAPALLRITRVMIDHLMHGTGGAAGIADAVGFIAANAAQGAFLLYIAIRDRRRRLAEEAALAHVIT